MLTVPPSPLIEPDPVDRVVSRLADIGREASSQTLEALLQAIPAIPQGFAAAAADARALGDCIIASLTDLSLGLPRRDD
jgi:hypothetical protein